MANQAHIDLGFLCQEPQQKSNGFVEFVSHFCLLAAKSAITDNAPLIEWFIRGLDPKLAQLVLLMEVVPSSLDDWIDHAATFHTNFHCLTDLHN
ncbi:hypothetical protein J3R83DRAFT_3374 [Lanmaoa asiatica]|nr:hypothetical protein J3R83DRAFT_3374 [Lanmaoa asiatica]